MTYSQTWSPIRDFAGKHKYLPGIHGEEGDDVRRPHCGKGLPQQRQGYIYQGNGQKQVVQSLLLFSWAVTSPQRRNCCIRHVNKACQLCICHTYTTESGLSSSPSKTTGEVRTLTEHPHRPHAHEAPYVRVVRRKEQVEWQNSAHNHADVRLCFEDGVESSARLRRILALGGRRSWCKCRCSFPHHLQFHYSFST